MNRGKPLYQTILQLTVLLLLTQLACNLPSLGSGGGGEVASPVSDSPPAPSASPTERPEPVALDLCTLITQAEAEAVLGGTVEVVPYPEMGNCTYNLQTGDPYQQQMLYVGAAQGDEGKELLMMGIGALVLFSQNDAIRNQFETLGGQLATMSLKELVEQLPPLYEAIGYEVSDQSGLGDLAFWSWNADFKIGVLLVVQGDSYANISLIGLEQDIALGQAKALMPTVLDRLPPAFTVLPASSPSPDATTGTPETAAVPTEVPPPTPETSTIWVADVHRGQVVRIDAASEQIVAVIDIGVYPADVAAGEGGVWVPNLPENAVLRIDPASNQIVTRIPFTRSISRLEAGLGAVWVVGEIGAWWIDPATNTASPILENEVCDAVAVGENGVWVTQSGQNKVLRIDPVSKQIVASIPVEGRPTEISAGRGFAWVIQPDLSSMARIDPQTNAVADSFPILSAPSDVDADLGGVWLAAGRRVLRIDPLKLEIGSNIDPGGQTWGITVGAQSVWVTLLHEAKVARLDLLHYTVTALIEVGGQPQRITAGP